ncbi:MAG: SPFH domain-containing protein [Gemmataceae bacterium]
MNKRLLLLLIPLGAYLLTGVAQVRPGERAVVRRFGRVVAQPAPGLWVGLPWGMDRVDRVPVNFVRRAHIGYDPEADDNSFMPAGQYLTGDQNLVNVQAAIDYSVGDGDAVVQYVIQQDRVESAIARAAEALLAEWIARHSVDEVLLTGKVALRTWLVPRLQERLGHYALGLQVQSMSVTYLSAPDEVKPEFDRVMIAQAKINTLENDARQEAFRLNRKAQGDENDLKQQADAYAEGRKRLAQAEANAFLVRWEQYQRLKKDNPDMLTAIWWAEMGKTLANLKANGQVDILDDKIGTDGLDITQFARPKKK